MHTLDAVRASGHDADGYFAPLTVSHFCLLTTFRRAGTPVATPVNVVVEGDAAYFRTWDTSGKARRLRHTPRVELRPCNRRGQAREGDPVPATATLLAGEESRHAADVLGRQHPLVHRLIVPPYHRLRGWATQQYRLDPPPGGPGRAGPASS